MTSNQLAAVKRRADRARTKNRLSDRYNKFSRHAEVAEEEKKEKPAVLPPHEVIKQWAASNNIYCFVGDRMYHASYYYCGHCSDLDSYGFGPCSCYY